MTGVDGRLIFSGIAFLMALSLAGPGYAESSRPSPGGAPKTAPHIFAFSGTECPPSSRPYEGPENDAAIEQGVIYCVFTRTATRVSKADFGGKCPPDMKLAKEVNDYLWCALPQDAIFGVRHTLNLGIPKGPQMQGAAPPVMMLPAPVESPAAPVTAAPQETPTPELSSMDPFRAWLAKLFQ